MEPAVGLLEFASIARGIEAGDAMIKRAPLEVIRAGRCTRASTWCWSAGSTADVEEAHGGRARGRRRRSLVDVVFLLTCTRTWWRRSAGRGGRTTGEALGVIETPTVAATSTRPTPA